MQNMNHRSETEDHNLSVLFSDSLINLVKKWFLLLESRDFEGCFSTELYKDEWVEVDLNIVEDHLEDIFGLIGTADFFEIRKIA